MDYSLLLGIHDRARGNDGAAAGHGGHQQQQPGGGGQRWSAASGIDEDGGATTGDKAGSDEPWSGDDAPAGLALSPAGQALAAAIAGATGGGGAAINFTEHGVDAATLQRRLAAVEERIGTLSSLSAEAKGGLLQLACVEMLSGGAHGQQQQQQQQAQQRAPSAVVAAQPKRSSTMRPLALTDGSSDALALSLGQSRVQLGAAMAATALPTDGGGFVSAGASPLAAAGANGGGAFGHEDEGSVPAGARDVILFFGIIDIFTVRTFGLCELVAVSSLRRRQDEPHGLLPLSHPPVSHPPVPPCDHRACIPSTRTQNRSTIAPSGWSISSSR
jgi:hypothetical protein